MIVQSPKFHHPISTPRADQRFINVLEVPVVGGEDDFLVLRLHDTVRYIQELGHQLVVGVTLAQEFFTVLQYKNVSTTCR